MNYNEAMNFVNSYSKSGKAVTDLSRARELMKRIGNPEKQLKFVHVAGTNGKGSTVEYISNALIYSGYKTGQFTSPYITHYADRIRVNGQEIDEKSLCEIAEKVKNSVADAEYSQFEITMAIALLWYVREKCDIVVLEVGMGGRLDSTNVIKTPVLSVITEISLDHTAILGDTVSAIAKEKAGIVKEGVPVLFAGTDEEAFAVVEKEAVRKNSLVGRPLYNTLSVKEISVDGSLFSYDGKDGFRISLAGTYQPRNAAAVIEATEILRNIGYRIGEDALRAGLLDARWSARFELLCRDPIVIYDGGHNPGGVAVSFESAAACLPGTKFTLLTGVMADKDYKQVAAIAAPHAACVYTVTPNVPRALDAEAYADVYRALGVPSSACLSIEDGVAAAVRNVRASGRPLIIFGSLYMYADVYAAVERAVQKGIV